MSRRTLDSLSGFSNDIGFYLSGMEDVRAQLCDAVEGMSGEQINCLAVTGAHSIAALVLHIGEAEWWWIQSILSGHKVDDEIRNSAYWDVLKDPLAVSKKNYSANFCLNEIRRIREDTFATLASFDDSQLDRVFSDTRNDEKYDLTLRYILHHLIDHEAQHKGQILMLKRLLAER